ncbi:membrane protein [Shewanella mangrovi]|uniref:Membrane protein n=1 Tax=Shewanella mangrovi TaxID=1515746 RepID=A0A094JEQ6_9GAMM|nr:rhombosortase [Shewanella mangrovi]KFZ36529.1 membrane protein [Shewanella mangrovi]
MQPQKTLWFAVIALSLVSAALQLLGLSELLAFKRSDIAHGEWWRLISGNVLHTNWWHVAMNLAGMWVVVFIHRMHYHAIGFLCLMLALCLFEGTGLYLAVPSLWGYVGLSGILHGLFAFGSLCDIQKHLRSGYLLLAGVIAKVTWEQYAGGNPEVTSLIGAPVATQAHLIGLLSGLLLWGLYWGWCRTRQTTET